MSERTKIRLAKSEGFLFDTRTGYKVLEFGFNESGEQLNEVDADQIMQSVNKDAPRNGNSLVELELARSAPETTASPSKAAAVEGILTEEELNSIELEFGFIKPIMTTITSHRLLLSANAEQKLALEAIAMLVMGEMMAGNKHPVLINIGGFVKHVLEDKT